ncbi:MAG TPA: GIY-YIG nuclease family protein [Ignavibacteriaceae bacterium]|nr:GIY-YIG nuclease family protein [Ignavibacteriaceae bacterium]
MSNWFTYILYSLKINRYYVGSTDDLDWRLERHNLGWGRYSKKGIPWKLIYYETFQTKTQAIRREKEIKSKKSRLYIEKLVKAGGRPEYNSGSLVGPAKIK